MHERHYRLFIPCLIGLADSASASGTRAAHLEQPQATGTREAQMEQPQALERAKRNWNAAGSGTRAGHLELRAALFCIVCWQEILSPSHYPLERPQGS